MINTSIKRIQKGNINNLKIGGNKMKVSDLISKLQEVDGKNNVFLRDDSGYCYDFSGISFDDLNDIELYIACGDQEV